MASPYKIEVFPVPLCCGAAVITGFGFDGYDPHVEAFGQEDFDRLVKEFDSAIDDFEKRVGIFAPFARLKRDPYENPGEADRAMRIAHGAYYSGGRDHLTAYVSERQIRSWEDHLDRRGFIKTSSFLNQKSNRTVYVFSKTFGS